MPTLWSKPFPVEKSTTAITVDPARSAILVPESAAVVHCTVVLVRPIAVRVVVAVIRGEHHFVLRDERVAGVTRVSGYQQHVVVRLAEDNERAVLGVVPAEIGTFLKVKSQPVAAVMCQLMQQFVAEPVVSSGVVESDFKLSPHTVEDV